MVTLGETKEILKKLGAKNYNFEYVGTPDGIEVIDSNASPEENKVRMLFSSSNIDELTKEKSITLKPRDGGDVYSTGPFGYIHISPKKGIIDLEKFDDNYVLKVGDIAKEYGLRFDENLAEAYSDAVNREMERYESFGKFLDRIEKD